MSITETHPYNHLYPTLPGTRLIIVGTAPPLRFSNSAIGPLHGLDFEFFYGSETSNMWPFCEKIAEAEEGEKLFIDEMSSSECRRRASAFLRRRKAWMQDVLQEYHRKDGKSASAEDCHIVPEKFNDFRNIFAEPALSLVAFTSEQAAKWTFAALEEQQLAAQSELDKALAFWKTNGQSDPRERHKNPFLQSTISGRDTLFYLLPTPTNRSRQGLKLADKRVIYEYVLSLGRAGE